MLLNLGELSGGSLEDSFICTPWISYNGSLKVYMIGNDVLTSLYWSFSIFNFLLSWTFFTFPMHAFSFCILMEVLSSIWDLLPLISARLLLCYSVPTLVESFVTFRLKLVALISNGRSALSSETSLYCYPGESFLWGAFLLCERMSSSRHSLIFLVCSFLFDFVNTWR